MQISEYPRMILCYGLSKRTLLMAALSATLLGPGCGSTTDSFVSQQNLPPAPGTIPVKLLVNGAAGSVTQVKYVARNDQLQVTASGLFQAQTKVLRKALGEFEGEAQLPDTTTNLQLEVSSDYQGITLVQQGVLEIRATRALGDPVTLTVPGSGLDVKVPDLTGLRIDPVPPGPIPVGGEVRFVPSLPGKAFDPTPFVSFSADPRLLARRHPRISPGTFVPLRPIDGVVVTAFHQTAPSFFTGAGEGQPPVVKAFAGTSGLTGSFFAFPPGFLGGVQVGAGDLNGDGAPEVITAPNGGLEAGVSVFEPEGNLIGSFLAYPGFQGGVRLAAGDLDGDGRAEIITGPGPGMDAQIKVFDGLTRAQITDFLAFPGFSGGVTVAAADLDANGGSEIIVGTGPGTTPRVRVFNPAGGLLREFTPITGGFQGGVNVAGAKNRIATAPASGPGGGGEVKVFDRDGKLIDKLTPFPGYDGELQVSWRDYNDDGLPDLHVLPQGGGDQSTLMGVGSLIYTYTLQNSVPSGTFSLGTGRNPYEVAVANELDGLDSDEAIWVSNFFSETPYLAVNTTIDTTPSTTSRPLLVANSLGGRITGYDAPDNATGNAAPTLNLSPFSLPFHFAAGNLEAGDIYLSNNGSHSVSVLSQPVTGVSRTIQGPATTLNFPTGTALDAGHDILYVFDAQAGQGRIKAFHNASAANGAPPPDRIITGAFTNLFGAAYDPFQDRLYAAEAGANRILVFDEVSTLSGATVPSRTLTVPGLTNPEGLYLDVPMQHLYVTSQASGLKILGDLNGSGSLLAETTGVTNLRGVTFDPTTGTAYSSAVNQEVRQFRIQFNPSTLVPGISAGSPALAGGATLLNGPTGLLVRPAPPPPPQNRSY